ncbi:MAG: aminotransferase class I/II-fold pyridoxal phosphate-dependent enzyme [Butyrivibrio sp.]|nr:aminotransferase class I/II-fold pyridoxal phosphate-dependent enzyme [Butyrivibrio sp.]
MEHLFEKLACNGESNIYPCHMPGHKRNAWGELPTQLCRLDITEIEGFDNLHQPEGILLELQKKAAELYGAAESFYLINGSTGGILSAVSAALPAGGHILMARNCHKSAYHAAYLRNLEVSYLYPDVLEEYDIPEAVTPEQVSRGLEKAPGAEAVLVVSPTYEGRIADIAGISEIVHQRGIPLIVDEAHGAHLGLSREVHENSCRQGADLVIQSVHKTLPALTQTALLHVNGELTDRELLKRFLHIYQSSSPSYLLMASIDNALYYIEKEGERAFREFRTQYERMLERLSRCRVLKFLPADRERQDLGKLLISVKDAEITGRQLYDVLLDRYRIQTEMAAEDFVLAMFTVNDRQEGYERMTAALLEIDGSLKGRESRKSLERHGSPEKQEGQESRKSLEGRICPEVPGTGGCSLTAAWDRSKEEIPLEECTGRLAGEFVNLYPPGVPLLVPGEEITEELCRRIRNRLRQGLTVQGIRQQEGKYLLRVLKHEMKNKTTQ